MATWTDDFTSGPTSTNYDIRLQYAITPGYTITSGVITTNPDFQELMLTNNVAASGNDQYIEITIPASPYTNTIYGLGILQPIPNTVYTDGYFWLVFADGRIYTHRNGSFLGGGDSVWTMPSSGAFTMRLEKSGALVSIRINGTVITAVNYTDSSPLTNGGTRSYQGFLMQNGSAGCTYAEGGDVGGAGPAYADGPPIIIGQGAPTVRSYYW